MQIREDSVVTVARTPLGEIQGIKTEAGLAFRGIRFAQAPVGERRFQPPLPVTPWSDTYDATEFGPSAPQPNMSAPDAPLQLPVEPTDEDCLFLNVYTPAVDEAKRAVMVWIHGGGYVMGSGRAYDGSVFVREHDVVVVSINYRMGAFGFMHLGHLDADLASSVNNGILDQICALEWVRDNIAAFGGDPNNVMIFGESAGGTSTAMLVGCPRSEGLFHKAVIHSPHVDLIPVGGGHENFTNRCIKRLGGDPAESGMQTLMNASVADLTNLVMPDLNDPESFQPPALSVRTDLNVSFSPAIDGTLIPAQVADTVRARGADNVPIMGGGCRHEGTLFPTALGFKPDGGEFDESQAYKMFADAGLDPQRAFDVYEQFAPGSSPNEKLVYALTDTMFRNSMVRILDAAYEAGAPCWSWLCTWESDLPKLRATHAIELTFLWDWINDDAQPAMRAFAGVGAPADLGRIMREYWVRFAETGVPSAVGQPLWKPYETTHRPVLLLQAQCEVVDDFDADVRKLWFE